MGSELSSQPRRKQRCPWLCHGPPHRLAEGQERLGKNSEVEPGGGGPPGRERAGRAGPLAGRPVHHLQAVWVQHQDSFLLGRAHNTRAPSLPLAMLRLPGKQALVSQQGATAFCVVGSVW